MGVKVRERPKGSGVWWIFIDHQGKRKSKKIGLDKDLANDVAKKIEAKLVLGEFNIEQEKAPCPSFKKCAEYWFSLPHDWRESTRINYRSNLNKHIYPVLGKQKLDTIKRKDLKEFFDSLLIKGMASETVAGVRTVVSGVLSYALESELIENNPLHGIKIKYKSKQFEGDPLNEEEMFQLL